MDAENLRVNFEDAWGIKLDRNRGLTVVEIMHAIHNDEITGMYIMGENPAMSDPMYSMQGMHWRNWNILWCRTCFLPKPHFTPT